MDFNPVEAESMMLPASDRDVLRTLARRVAEVAARPVMAARREAWTDHNDLMPRRPMVLVFPEGAWRELLPEDRLVCEDPAARDAEYQLRIRLYTADHFDDDTVIENTWVVPKAITVSGWGLEPRWTDSPGATGAGTYAPVLNTAADIDKIKIPTVTHDAGASQARLAWAEELFGDILDVRLSGIQHVSFHPTAQYCRLRGLEEAMLDMCADPALVHAGMACLAAGHHAIIDAYERQNLLDLNNDNTYHASGGNGFTRQLPPPDHDPAHVCPRDMWASAESQEYAQVSPEMHAEFALRYEVPLLERFGLNGYGCCEDLTAKLPDVMKIPRLRRVSISPWADVPRCAEQLGRRCILSWKPHPGHLVGGFDADHVRAYLREAVGAAQAHGCVFEMILKDTHTCEHHPERFDQWTRIAREVVEKTVTDHAKSQGSTG